MGKTSYRVLTLIVGCMLLLSTTAQQVIAWPCRPPGEPCGDCYTCTETGCEWDCGAGETCCGGICCDPDDCCNGEYCCSGQECCTDIGAYCCPSGYTCCEGSCCDPATETCCAGTCCSNTCCNGVCCDPGEECCDGECAVPTDNCWGINLTIIYDGSCVCFDPPVTCMSNDDELRELGYGKIASYVRECVKVPSGTCGRTQCDVFEGENQLIAKLWTCRDETDMMGVLLCWEINALVCIAECSAAVSACAVNPGSPECSQGLNDCLQCLTSKGIDCGCLTVSCFYNVPPDEIWGETLAAYGPKCKRQ